MHHIIGYVAIGAALGGVSAIRVKDKTKAEAEGKAKVRPVLRSLVKGGIVAKRKIDAYRAAAVSEAQKLVEEARAELDQPSTEHEA
jgi:hypothetical protein